MKKWAVEVWLQAFVTSKLDSKVLLHCVTAVCPATSGWVQSRPKHYEEDIPSVPARNRTLTVQPSVTQYNA